MAQPRGATPSPRPRYQGDDRGAACRDRRGRCYHVGGHNLFMSRLGRGRGDRRPGPRLGQRRELRPACSHGTLRDLLNRGCRVCLDDRRNVGRARPSTPSRPQPTWCATWSACSLPAASSRPRSSWPAARRSRRPRLSRRAPRRRDRHGPHRLDVARRAASRPRTCPVDPATSTSTRKTPAAPPAHLAIRPDRSSGVTGLAISACSSLKRAIRIHHRRRYPRTSELTGASNIGAHSWAGEPARQRRGRCLLEAGRENTCAADCVIRRDAASPLLIWPPTTHSNQVGPTFRPQ